MKNLTKLEIGDVLAYENPHTSGTITINRVTANFAFSDGIKFNRYQGSDCNIKTVNSMPYDAGHKIVKKVIVEDVLTTVVGKPCLTKTGMSDANLISELGTITKQIDELQNELKALQQDRKDKRDYIFFAAFGFGKGSTVFWNKESKGKVLKCVVDDISFSHQTDGTIRVSNITVRPFLKDGSNLSKNTNILYGNEFQNLSLVC